MSTLKIVGTESELRLDCDPKDGGEADGYSEREGSAQLINQVIEISNAAPATNRESYLHKLERWIKTGRLREPSINEILDLGDLDRKIIDEHANRDSEYSTRRYDRLLRNAEMQLRGFSGGYTPSGHRAYVDGDHPEICTPECSNPKDLVCWEKAGEMIVLNASRILSEKTDYNFTLYKDNSDGFGNTWGYHENYLVGTKLFRKLVKEDNFVQAAWITFLITRIIYTGAGKLGYDKNHGHLMYGGENNVFLPSRQFLLSQRTEFLSNLVESFTTHHRPWINTRDISYVGSEYGSRLHVVAGDANRCDVATYLKVGMSMIVLMMLEDEYALKKWPIIANIIYSATTVNEDIGLKQKLRVGIGNKIFSIRAIDVQKIILDNSWSWYESLCINEHPKEKVQWIPELLKELTSVIDSISSNRFEALFGKIDWITKLNLFKELFTKMRIDHDRFIDGKHPNTKYGTEEAVNYFRKIDRAYHKLGERGIYTKLSKSSDKFDQLISEDAVNVAMSTPPDDTRAFDRGSAISKWGELIRRSNWAFVGLDDREIVLRSPWRSVC